MAGAFLAGMLMCGAAVAQEAAGNSAQPYELVRSLQSLQDKITTGNKAMQEARPSLMARVAESFKAAPREVWSDPRNMRAAVIYLLNGGDAKIVQAIQDAGLLPKTDTDLVEGALAYAAGDFAKARKKWELVDARDLPASVGSHVAFAQAALTLKDAPELSLKSLDLARLLGPGTLIEEASLRRELSLLQAPEQADRLLALGRHYLARFGQSIYADEVRGRYLRLLPPMLGDMHHDIAVARLLGKLPERDAAQIYLAAASVAVTHGRAKLAESWARNVTGMAGIAGAERSRAWLYVAASRVNEVDYTSGRQAMAQVEAGQLLSVDAQLYRAVQAILALNPEQPVQAEVHQVEAHLAETQSAQKAAASAQAIEPPSNLVENARALLAGTDQLLSELKP